MDEIKLISLQNNETKVIMELVKENNKLKSQNKTQMESINGLLKKVDKYENALRKISKANTKEDHLLYRELIELANDSLNNN